MEWKERKIRSNLIDFRRTSGVEVKRIHVLEELECKQ